MGATVLFYGWLRSTVPPTVVLQCYCAVKLKKGDSPYFEGTWIRRGCTVGVGCKVSVERGVQLDVVVPT